MIKQVNDNQNKVNIDMLIPDKRDLKAKGITRNEEYIISVSSIYQEVPNSRGLNNKLKLHKTELQ